MILINLAIKKKNGKSIENNQDVKTARLKVSKKKQKTPIGLVLESKYA